MAVVIVMSFTLVPAIAKLYTSMKASSALCHHRDDDAVEHPDPSALSGGPAALSPSASFSKNGPTSTATRRVQRLVIAIPTVGGIVRKSAAAVSFRVLAMLLQANVRISLALDIAAPAAPPTWIFGSFLAVRERVAEGQGLPESFLQESGTSRPRWPHACCHDADRR